MPVAAAVALRQDTLQARQHFGRNAGAGIPDREGEPGGVVVRACQIHADRDVAGFGKAGRMVQQVPENLTQVLEIADQHARQVRIDFFDQGQAFLLGRRTVFCEQGGDKLREGEGRGVEAGLPGFQGREINQVVDQVHQLLARSTQGRQQFALARGELILIQQITQAQNAIHRRTQFVADIGEKFSLEAVGQLGFKLRGLELFDQARFVLSQAIAVDQRVVEEIRAARTEGQENQGHDSKGEMNRVGAQGADADGGDHRPGKYPKRLLVCRQNGDGPGHHAGHHETGKQLLGQGLLVHQEDCPHRPGKAAGKGPRDEALIPELQVLCALGRRLALIENAAEHAQCGNQHAGPQPQKECSATDGRLGRVGNPDQKPRIQDRRRLTQPQVAVEQFDAVIEKEGVVHAQCSFSAWLSANSACTSSAVKR